MAKDLQACFGVAIAPDNQAVADACDVVVVSIRPQQAREVLAPLKFRAGQTVLSVMAGSALPRYANSSPRQSPQSP
jgi:pyrroline-5-carboxylate reductase